MVSSPEFCAQVNACQKDAFDAYQDDGMCASLAVSYGDGVLAVAGMDVGCTEPLTSVASEMSSATTCAAFTEAYGSYCTALATCASCTSRRLSEGLEARRYEAQVHVGFSDWQNADAFLDRIKKEEPPLPLYGSTWFDESVTTNIAELRLVSWTEVRTNHGADIYMPRDSAAASLSGGVLGLTLLAVTTTALLRGLLF